ncbi:MFS transporter [Microlunatus soli]|uniref:Putative proline/betaine transporter n=1 Tax=Microlunatus soli TaxID=630515 RepID=A0A1H1ZL50_9ACTN|nr:MFS transporter [Microlunatus soli]SDT34551.1 MFS transporter, MHS family, proline/betaine transporter [Microlunatus soli]
MSSAQSVPAADGPKPKDAPPGVLRKAIAGSAIGNATEWFDYGVYGATTIYITKHLFPDDSSTIWVLLGFAISFLIRPLGGFVWGPLGDRLGRRAVLAMTIILMGLATALIGLIPNYSVIGIGAPALLFLLRMIQGFSTGGEYGGAATFMAEYSPDRKRGFCGSFLEFGTLAGLTLGPLLVLFFQVVLPESAMQAWGWRIPFLIALPLAGVGLYLRSKLEDTPVFRELEDKGEKNDKATTALKDLITAHWRPILTLMALVVALNVVNYTLLQYMPTYLQETLKVDPNKALSIVSVGQVLMMIVIPFSGALSDRVGRKPMWLVSLIGLFVLAVPMYLLMTVNFGLAILAFAILGLLYIPQLSTISATFPAMFPTQVRYAGFAVGYNVSTSLFGGTSPVINEAIIGATGFNLTPAIWMMGACLIGFLGWLSMKETAGASIRGTKVPEAARTATGKFIRPAGA